MQPFQAQPETPMTMDTSAYLRFPTLFADTIAFVADDDLWQVGTAGGLARRLTAGLSEPSTPCLSPDGKWIAFIGRDEQHAEVYVMPAEGGPAKRLTWLGPDTLVRGWTPEGHILFVSTHGQPFFRNHRAYTLAPEGGAPLMLPLGQVNHLAFGPEGARVIGRNTADPARWKRYRGGTAGHLWIDAAGTGQYRRMTELKGNITSPMWVGGRIYHLSDAEGIGNLYSCLPDDSGLRRHTHHEDFYARHAQTDGTRIVYQCGAELWLYEPATDTPTRLDVRTPAHRTQAARKFVAAADHLGAVHVHPAGHSVAIDARGKLVTMALWEGAVRQHDEATPAAPAATAATAAQAGAANITGRLSHGQWLADGATLVAVSDASGEERITVFTSEGEGSNGRALPWDVGHVTALRAAPHGTLVAVANHRNQVLIGDTASGVLTTVDASDAGRSDDLAWSPDATWLAYTFQTSPRHTAIKLHGVGSGTSLLVTKPEFRDYSPSFDPEGKYLYFLSLRTFDPVYDSVQFELSFPRAARPYLIALKAGGAPPFDPAPKGLKPDNRDADATLTRKDDPTAGTPAASMQIDLPGIAQRIAPFPVSENRFGRLVGAGRGKVLWSIQGIVGAHGRGGHKEAPARLEVFDFATLRTEPLGDKADSFELAADHTTLVLREGKRLRAISVAAKPATEKDAASGPPSRKTGWLDLDRIRLSVEPRREWPQMLREVWRLQRDQFWVANMSGVDWNAVYARYEPLVARVATRGELSDLVWEMQGELGTSHAYEMGGDHRRPPSVALGYLGAETRFVPADQSYEITRLVCGDAWDAGADSPLNAVGVEVKVGERIVAVNGQRVSAERPPEALLVHQANAKVELTLASADAPGSAASTRRVLVHTLADEVPARYREWVEHNRGWVHEQSGGRVGYFHLPDMMAAGYAEFHRYFSAECDYPALIVDVRYNRGGHVSQLLLEKVARKRIGYALTRWSKPSPYPDESVAGPVVALTNEHAGSDGDIFSHSFKLMGIGPLVGTRTWGGVVGIWPRRTLVDGTATTQPEFAYWFGDVGFGVENHGTDPQIEIDNAPQDAATGNDRQLEVALATALSEIVRTGAEPPEFGAMPDLSAPPWPARS
ncbi:MAG: PDZ domain-containing protein [Bacteriovorax sp.]|nr:PDZ domain-containing protein [Rhizobacter sp.]